MPRLQPPRSIFARTGLAVALLASTSASAASKVLVVPSTRADAAVVDAGLRTGLASVADAQAADPAATASLIEGARSSGLTCGPDDGACWLRLAVLGGLDHVVFVSGDAVTHASAAGSRVSPALGATDAAWASAVRRAFAAESAFRITANPAAAVVKLDDVVTTGVVEGVVPGSHVVAASAAGYVDKLSTVVVAAGDVRDVVVTLDAVPVAPPTPPPSPLFIGGLVGVGVGVAGVLGASVYSGVVEFNHSKSTGQSCTTADLVGECAAARNGWYVAMAAGAVAFVGGVVTVVGAFAE